MQEHYYADPPRIERGWRQHLAGTDGRVYLDMVNNVSVLGHAHPRLEAAVARQLRRLNTNSRFHYAAVAEFAERLAGLLPEPLDTVFLVNSGSEAVDLALRLALVTTGRQDVVAVREAYHGWTYASDAVSTSTADNPSALDTRPGWVHAVDAPNAYRGRYRGPAASRYAADAVGFVPGWRPAGGRPRRSWPSPTTATPAAWRSPTATWPRSTPRSGGTAGWPSRTRSRSATAAWATGSGGSSSRAWCRTWSRWPRPWATATRWARSSPPARSPAYRDAGYFFSSTGGSPVSCVAGLAVLDVIESEGLQANAALVGSYLKGRLEELAGRHPLIGAVHGSGLYLGVEFVRDRDTLEPATAETMAICDRMLELGVVMQPTSDRMCVLKIKPPLCLDIAGADFFADALDRVLTEGW